MKAKSREKSTAFAAFKASVIGLFSSDQGPTKTQVSKTLRDAREMTEQLRLTREKAARVQEDTQKVLSAARSANGAQ